MSDIYPITVFYDGSCPLCAEEINLMRTVNTQNRLRFINCAAQDFDETPYLALGISRQIMLQQLHVQTAQQQWLSGIPAMTLLYRALELRLIAQLLGGRFSQPLALRVYPHFVRLRFVARWLGIGWLFRQLNHFYAKRALKRSQACQQGHCEIRSTQGE